MDGADHYTVEALGGALARHGVPAAVVADWWRSERLAGQPLAEFLASRGVLRSEAPATLRSMRRGHLCLDPDALLAESAGECLRGGAARPASPPAAVTRQTLVLTADPTNATPTVSPPATSVGVTLGRCVLTRLIGAGGGGCVYEALHLGLAITVAVKTLSEANISPAVRRALRDEARLLARLNYPHAVRVYDYCDDGGTPYLVMEHVAGSSLADLLGQCGSIAPARAAGMLAQAARGLAAALQLGIVHRDVKPANLLVTKQGQVKIADLGLACLQGAGGGPAKFGGTVAYMAPERFGDGQADERSDLYALGVTLYEMLTGRLPFCGTSPMEVMLQHVDGVAADPRDFNPLIPESLVAVCARLMWKDPTARYAGYGELLDDLARFFSLLPERDAVTDWNPFIPTNFDSAGYSTAHLSSRGY